MDGTSSNGVDRCLSRLFGALEPLGLARRRLKRDVSRWFVALAVLVGHV